MHNGRALKKADPSTIQDKLLVGYQGWFTCAGDGEPVGRGHHGWLHWFNYPVPDGGRPNTDIWPDVSEYDPSELYEAPGLRTYGGEKCHLFSSRNQKTVDRHFNWMAQHGVDGAFLQRFAGQCDGREENSGIRKIRDEVGDRVREAAEKNGRAYAIMYDVSGVPPSKIEEIIKLDWKDLVFNKRIFDSPSYLREKGKPVVALWGFGFEDSRHTPGIVRSIASYINGSHPGGVYLMAGVPAHWRTSTGDADRNPEFVDVWLDCFDAISPWTIGRYENIADADRFAEEKIAGDMKLIGERNKTVRAGRKLDYIPVVFPGGSSHNLSEGKLGFDNIPREGGRFLWRQIYNARKSGVRTIYGAMWDEYDEGTALMPIVTYRNQLPTPVREKYRFLAPDAGNIDLPPDWYMRISGMAAEILHGDRRVLETFPHKELQDYWGTRPRYEGGTSGGYKSADSKPEEATKHILAAEENSNEPPPPPYTLEAGNEPEKSPTPTREGFSTAPTSPNNQQNYNVSNLANDLGRQSLASPPQSPSHPDVPGGPRPETGPRPNANLSGPPTGPRPEPASRPSVNLSGPSTGPPPVALANKPSSRPQSATPQTVPSSTPPFFPPPVQPIPASQGVGMPLIPVPDVMHGSNPVNFNTPFHWNDDYPKPQQQPLGGYSVNTPANPWDPPASTQPQETSFQPGYRPGYSSPPPTSQHGRPGTKPTLPSQSPHEATGAFSTSPSYNNPGNALPSGYNPPYSTPQSTYPGLAEPSSYYGYDQKTDGWGGLPPSNSSYPGQGPSPSQYPGSAQRQSSYPGQTHSGYPPPSNSPPLSQGYDQYQSSYPGITSSPMDYPGKTHTGPPPLSNSPPLAQGAGGYGQIQSGYPGMTSSPTPGPPDRPPTSNSTSLPQGYGQQQSSYQGMTSSPPPGPDRPSTSHSTRPTTPYHQSSLPPQVHPPLPGAYDYSSGPPQSTYGGINPSASPPPPSMYQSTGPSTYGYQQQQQSTYPGYNPPPPSTSPYPGYPGSMQPHMQDGPTSPGGPGGPGFNQNPYQPSYSQHQPQQGYGGQSSGLSHSASTSSNANAPWKKQQMGVMGLAKDTMDKFGGKDAMKNVQSMLKPFLK